MIKKGETKVSFLKYNREIICLNYSKDFGASHTVNDSKLANINLKTYEKNKKQKQKTEEQTGIFVCFVTKGNKNRKT